jgi:hypothetical protein
LIETASDVIVKVLPADWSQEISASPDGELSLVIMSPDGGATTLLVTVNGAGYRFHALREDELWLLGECNSVGRLAWLVDSQIRLETSISRRVA